MAKTLAESHPRVAKREAARKLAPKSRWREAIGFAKDDPLLRKAMRLGAAWREKANQAGR